MIASNLTFKNILLASVLRIDCSELGWKQGNQVGGFVHIRDDDGLDQGSSTASSAKWSDLRRLES